MPTHDICTYIHTYMRTCACRWPSTRSTKALYIWITGSNTSYPTWMYRNESRTAATLLMSIIIRRFVIWGGLLHRCVRRFVCVCVFVCVCEDSGIAATLKLYGESYSTHVCVCLCLFVLCSMCVRVCVCVCVWRDSGIAANPPISVRDMGRIITQACACLPVCVCVCVCVCEEIRATHQHTHIITRQFVIWKIKATYLYTCMHACMHRRIRSYLTARNHVGKTRRRTVRWGLCLVYTCVHACI